MKRADLEDGVRVGVTAMGSADMRTRNRYLAQETTSPPGSPLSQGGLPKKGPVPSLVAVLPGLEVLKYGYFAPEERSEVAGL
jgi:hypothetical protein